MNFCRSAIAACHLLWVLRGGLVGERILHLIRCKWPEGHSKTSYLPGWGTTLSFFPCFYPVPLEDQIWVDSNIPCADFALSAERDVFSSSHQVTSPLTFPEPTTHMTTSFFVVSRDRYSVQAVMLSYVLDSSTIFWNIVLFLWEERKKMYKSSKIQNKETNVLKTHGWFWYL